jgi:hypothetical protein
MQILAQLDAIRTPTLSRLSAVHGLHTNLEHRAIWHVQRARLETPSRRPLLQKSVRELSYDRASISKI